MQQYTCWSVQALGISKGAGKRHTRSILQESPENPPDLPDIDRIRGEDADMASLVWGNDNVSFRELERHMDERSPVQARRDPAGCFCHQTGNPEERPEFHVARIQERLAFMEHADSHNSLHSLYPVQQPHIRIFPCHRLRISFRV